MISLVVDIFVALMNFTCTRSRIVFILFLLFIVLLLGLPSSIRAQSCPTIPTTAASSTATVEISATADYKIWSRFMTPNSTSNSYYLQVDSQCAIVVGDDQTLPVNTWVWVDYKDGITTNSIVVNLASGTHVIKLIEREPGLKVDKVLFSSNLSCIPTGLGGNCTVQPTATVTVAPTTTLAPTATPTIPIPTPTTPISITATPTLVPDDTTAPTIVITSPVSGGIVVRRSKVVITAQATDNSGINRVEFYVNNNLVSGCNDSTFPYECIWNVPGKRWATYNLTAKAYDTYNNQATSSVVNVTAR